MAQHQILLQQVRPNATMPQYMSAAAAGADLTAALEVAIILHPRERRAIPCGFKMELPAGLEAQIRPRSGLALKNGISVANAPGTIDADYRGEVQVILVNLGGEDFTIEPGSRIAQMVIAPVVQGAFSWVEELGQTERGQGGFGSTGVR